MCNLSGNTECSCDIDACIDRIPIATSPCGTLALVDVNDSEARERLAQAVKRRRQQLKLRQEDISARGGPSRATLFKIENASAPAYADDSIAALEHVLRLEAGSLRAVSTGGSVVEMDEPPAGLPGDDPEQIVVEYKGWRFTMTPRPGATAAEIEAAQTQILSGVLVRLRELGLEDGPDS